MFGQRQSIELSHLDSGKRGDGTRLLIEIAKEAKKRKCDIYTVAVRIDIAKEHPLGFYLKHGFKPIGENSDDIMKAFQGAQEQGHHFDWKGEGVSLKLLYEDLDKLIKNDLF